MKEEIAIKIKTLYHQIKNLENLSKVNDSKMLKEFLKCRKRALKKLLIKYKRILLKEKVLFNMKNIKPNSYNQKNIVLYKKILPK